MRWLGGRGRRRRNNSIDAVLCDTKQRMKMCMERYAAEETDVYRYRALHNAQVLKCERCERGVQVRVRVGVAHGWLLPSNQASVSDLT